MVVWNSLSMSDIRLEISVGLLPYSYTNFCLAALMHEFWKIPTKSKFVGRRVLSSSLRNDNALPPPPGWWWWYWWYNFSFCSPWSQSTVYIQCTVRKLRYVHCVQQYSRVLHTAVCPRTISLKSLKRKNIKFSPFLIKYINRYGKS